MNIIVSSTAPRSDSPASISVSGISTHDLGVTPSPFLLAGIPQYLMETTDKISRDQLRLPSISSGTEDGASIFPCKASIPENAEAIKGDDAQHRGVLEEHEMTVAVPTEFLSSLINQSRAHHKDLQKQIHVNERLREMLTRAKRRSKKLKFYVNALSDELRYVMYKMGDQMVQQIKSHDTQLTTRANKTRQQEQQSVQPKDADDPKITAKVLVYMQERIVELERVLKEEENKRKKLHNKLQELIGNIRVYCRIRPHPEGFMRVSSDDKLIIPAESLPERSTRGWGSLMKCFIFDRVFDGTASQDQVFEAVQDLIVSCVDGYNVCIMAYGQTGSGKTHTMMGTPQQPGVNRRSVHHLLDICRARKQWSYRLSVSIMEIYQEEIYDLLTPPGSKQLNVVKMMATQEDELVLQNLVEQEVSSESDVLKYLEMGEKSRKVASTLMNHASSRSHFVMLLRVKGENKIHKTTSNGTLTLCYLAGSENVSKSGATGERFQEAASINRSLTALGRAFDLLRKKQKPCYRETKLTHLLKPTLGGDDKCLLIINVRSELQNADESLRAIQFGQNAKQVTPEQLQHRNSVRTQASSVSCTSSISGGPQLVPSSSSSCSLVSSSRFTKC